MRISDELHEKSFRRLSEIRGERSVSARETCRHESAVGTICEVDK